MYTVYSEKHSMHATDDVLMQGVPFISREIPTRARVIYAAIEHAKLGPIIMPTDYGLDPILAIHKADFVEYLQMAYTWNAAWRGIPGPVLVARSSVTAQRASKRPQDMESLQEYYTFDYEDPILEHTWEAAYWSVQCALTAAALVSKGERVAYALCRPPGHHATVDQYGGFCYLNLSLIHI